MEKISTKKELIERLEQIRDVEVIARDSYSSDIITFKNFEIVDTIAKIRKDEFRHIKLIDDMLDLLKNSR
jgi:hypothetical protein